MSVIGTELAYPAMLPNGRYRISKRTLGNPRQSAAPQGLQQDPRPYRVAGVAGPVADSLEEPKAAFRTAWGRGAAPGAK
jgi:hypothetical protein